jgi:MYXO-CTERM domain-containing protein
MRSDIMRTSILCAAAVVCAGHRADAFCGFYVGGAGAELFNHATEVVLMRHGTTTVLSMQNNYQGPPEQFALVVPVPVVVKQSQVKTLPRELFAKIDTLGAPRLVEYWEMDPCAPEVDRDFDGIADSSDEDGSEDDKQPKKRQKDYHVTIEAKFSVGEYDIVVLSATQSTGLESWLRDNRYAIPKQAEPLLRPYVEQGTKFFVAKVDPKKVRFVNGMATLSPLRFHYDSPELVLPIRLGLANSSGTQDLIVNVLAPNNTRYEVANHPNITIPTNLIVTDAVRGRFGEFYAALFDHAIARTPGAVVTEYAWDASSCDPCPGPTLDGNDLATLGADVLGGSYRDASGGFTLTRLHARYGKDVADDLVFRAVKPISGGRGIPDERGVLSNDVATNQGNDFQGRYVILHRWTGATTCAAPQRGRWGGPPDQQVATQAASNIAFAPRGNVQLASLVAQDVPQIGVMASGGVQLPPPVRAQHGCGCRARGGASATFALLVVFWLVRRRRRA